MIGYIWLLPLLPLTGAVVNLFFGKRLGRGAGYLAVAMMVGAFAGALLVLKDILALPDSQQTVIHTLFSWIHVGSFTAAFDVRVDPLSTTVILVVTGVGMLIHIYAQGYMNGDPRYGRFFAYMNLFVFFMLMLVLANNLLLLYLGWEGVGLCSYLLVGFWFERPRASAAAKKAFIVTRIGDTLMLIGIVFVFIHFGTLDFSVILKGSNVSTTVALLLFAGAVGKSAQLPLHVWLPDAMEGPTPVSALIHAATMVTAGVYLIVRTNPMFPADALAVVAVVGLLTALYAATAAVGQDDIKRVLAYSTISQLGYMFFAAGLKDFSGAMFLLVAHAFYKGLMFLSAGSVMHGLGGSETDLNKMGGLRKYMPVTSTVFIIGALGIAGIPPLVGFFAKDPILAFADESGHVVMWLTALVAAFFSAFYISRLIFLTFFGSSRGGEHPHESPRVMTVPMMVLAALTLFGGLLGTSAAHGALEQFLQPVLGAPLAGHQGLPEGVLTAIGIAIAFAGVGVGWLVYGSGRIDWAALQARFAGLMRFLKNGWYIDDAYASFIGAPATAFAAFLAFVVDKKIIDGAANDVGRDTASLATVVRRMQTGLVRTYALVFLIGAFAAVFLFEVMR